MTAPQWSRLIARVYRAALVALPPGARGERDDMAAALEEQLRHAIGRREGLAAASRAFLRLPLVLAAEWIDSARLSRRSGLLEPHTRRGAFVQNLRFAARTLRKNPTFTWVSVLLIGMGVGAVTAIFTVVDQVLLRPLPYPDEDRLVYLTNGSHNGPTLRALDEVAVFDVWVAARGGPANLTRVGAEPLRLRSVEVPPAFFAMFGARPLLGRMLVEDDYTDRSVAVLTHESWVSIWGADPAIVGSTIQLDSEPVTVVGVLEQNFVNPERLIGRDTYVLRPMNWDDPQLDSPGYHAHSVAGRLAPSVDLQTAQAEMDRIHASLFEQNLLTTRVEGWPLVPLKDFTVREARDGLFLLLGSVGLLLLVACANVALLFMARGISRAREMSVRRALGARTRVLLGQLVTESLLVGFLGGVVGLVLARLTLGGFNRWIGDLPRSDTIILDTRVLSFTIALSGATALAFGLAPAVRSVGRDINSQLRESGRSSTDGRGARWVRGGLIVGEVGVSLVLVTLAGLLLRSFLAVTSQDPGLEAADVWMVSLNAPGIETADEYRRRMGSVLAVIETLPQVASATYGVEMPFENVGGNTCCWALRTAPRDVVDLRADGVLTYLHAVTEDFFETLGTRLVVGTSWTAGEAATAPLPVVLTQSLAIRHFGSAQAAMGQELQVLRYDDGPVRVIGVAEPTLHYGLDQADLAGMYLPIEGVPFGDEGASFAVRAPGASSDIVDVIRKAIWSVDPNLPVPSVVRLQSWIDDSSGIRRLSSALSSAFGAIALLLAAGGLYGTLTYAASQRRRELGIRIALGAGRGRIQGDLLAGGVGLVLGGLALGLPAAIHLGRMLESFLWNVSTTDPPTLVVSSLVLLGIAALASWLPAHRASRTDPLEVLKAE